MIDKAVLKIGDKVHYQPSYYGDDKWENGMIKEIRDNVDDAVWVVYNCNGEWHRFKDYTSAKTQLSDLFYGWKHEKPKIKYCPNCDAVLSENECFFCNGGSLDESW